MLIFAWISAFCPFFKGEILRSSNSLIGFKLLGLTIRETKNGLDIVLMTDEKQTNRENTALTVDVFGISATDSHGNTPHVIHATYHSPVTVRLPHDTPAGTIVKSKIRDLLKSRQKVQSTRHRN
jgi:hypothetical protein